MDSGLGGERPARPGREAAVLLLALLPLALLAFHAVVNAELAFIDDAVTMLMAQAPFGELFRRSESGRFFPLYWIYHALVPGPYPGEHGAVVLATANAACLGVGALLVARLVWALAARPASAGRVPMAGGPWPIVAAWLATVNLAAVENLYTLSKCEPLQFPLLVGSVALLCTDALSGASLRSTALAGALAVGAALTKESGVTLAAPFLVHAAACLSGRPDGRRRWGPGTAALAAAAALGGLAASSAWSGAAAGSYARDLVTVAEWHGPFRWLVDRGWSLKCLLVAGLVASVWLMVRRRGGERVAAAIVFAELAALFALFSVLPHVNLYYLLAPAGLAAACLAAALAGSGGAAPAEPPIALAGAPRWAAAAFAALLLAWATWQSVLGASALTGWEWLYGRLRRVVLTADPPRALFHLSGGLEVHQEARLHWNRLGGSSLTVGLLGAPADQETELPHVGYRELRPGDLIIEQFGTVENLRTPFRDMQATLPLDFGFERQAGWTARLAVVGDDRATFPAFRELPPAGVPTHLRWRILRVLAPPAAVLEGLDLDQWMHDKATLWVRRERLGEGLVIRADSFLPPGARNRLSVAEDGEPVASCPVMSGARLECRVPGPMASGGEWVRFVLSADTTYSPARAGISRDTRELSFNLAPFYRELAREGAE